jgi:hypothetical protein
VRSVIVALGVLAILGGVLASGAAAGEIPNDVLKDLGISKVQRLSDAQGMQVRGSGLAWVFGAGAATANLPGSNANQTNRHGATSNGSPAAAVGASGSEATATIKVLGLPVISTNATSLGYGSARAF